MPTYITPSLLSLRFTKSKKKKISFAFHSRLLGKKRKTITLQSAYLSTIHRTPNTTIESLTHKTTITKKVKAYNQGKRQHTFVKVMAILILSSDDIQCFSLNCSIIVNCHQHLIIIISMIINFIILHFHYYHSSRHCQRH